MSVPTPHDWRTLFVAAMSESESGQPGSNIEWAEAAIQERLREVVDSLSVVEESELYAALGRLRRVRAHFLAAA